MTRERIPYVCMRVCTRWSQGHSACECGCVFVPVCSCGAVCVCVCVCVCTNVTFAQNWQNTVMKMYPRPSEVAAVTCVTITYLLLRHPLAHLALPCLEFLVRPRFVRCRMVQPTSPIILRLHTRSNTQTVLCYCNCYIDHNVRAPPRTSVLNNS